MMQSRDKKILDQIIKNAEKGDFSLDPFIERSDDYIDDAYKANNLQERAIGRLMLEQYKGRVPNLNEEDKLTDFAEQLRAQFAPESKAQIKVDKELPTMGVFDPYKKTMSVNPKYGLEDFASTIAAHEPLHDIESVKGDYGNTGILKPGKDLNMKLKGLAPDLITDTGVVRDPKKLMQLIKNADINDVKELLLQGHHGFKRGATIAQHNLPRILKGLGVAGLGAISLGAEAADSPEAGDVIGQQALERDISASKKEKDIEKSDAPDDVKMRALELFKKNRLPY